MPKLTQIEEYKNIATQNPKRFAAPSPTNRMTAPLYGFGAFFALHLGIQNGCRENLSTFPASGSPRMHFPAFFVTWATF